MDAATWVAIVAAIFGGAGVKAVEKWLNRNQTEEDSALKLRSELRVELERLRDDLDKARKDVEEYQTKYYEVLEKFSKTNIDLQNALNEIQKLTTQAQNAIQGNNPPELS